MWLPKQLIVKNFMSHVDTKFEFQQGTVSLLIGNNVDDPGQKSNGSGKSVLVEALAYIYIGSGLKKVLDYELVRDGEKSAFIEHVLYNSRTKEELKIQREIFVKGSSTLKIFINNEDQSDKFPTVPEGNKFLLDLIGISRKDLLSYYIISKEKYVSFYSSGDNEKKEAIARFSKADKLDGIDQLIKLDIDSYNKKIDTLNDDILKCNTQIETYNEQIEEENKKDYEKIKKDQINQYKEQVANYEKEIKGNEGTISWYITNNKILENHKDVYTTISNIYKKEFSKIKGVDYSNELNKLNLKENSIKEEERRLKVIKNKTTIELSEGNDFIADVKNHLAGIIECPKCSHRFLLDDSEDFDIKDAEKNLPLYERAIKDIEKKIDKFDKDISKFKDKYDEVDDKRNEIRKKIQDVQNKKNALNLKIKRCENGTKSVDIDIKSNSDEINRLKDEIKAYNETIDKIRGNIENIKKSSQNENIAQIEGKIKVLESQVKEKEKEIQKQEEEKFKYEQWIYNFVRFKSFLANKSIKNIEGITNMMLGKMKSNLQIYMDGYKVLKSGEIREKITTNVYRNGFDEGNFFKKSGGEKGRIEIATISAMQQLINLSTNSGGLDSLIVDEIVVESIDGEGIVHIANSANKLHKTINIITHVDIPSGEGYNLITIEKRNKISKII